MAGSTWVELSVEASNEAVDAIAEVFRSEGIEEIAIEPDIHLGPDEGFHLRGSSSLIKAWLPEGPRTANRIERLGQALWHLRAFDLAPLSELSTKAVAEEDWANAWKEHFHPFRVGERLVIRPSWREITVEPMDIVVQLDPGMAFGTGLHPTTRLMLEAMEDHIVPGASVFDLGTGSGVLSVAAAKLGAAQVLAVDVDEVAVRVCQENVDINCVASTVTVEHGSVERGNDTYDVVLANIIAAVLADLAQDLARRVKAHGVIIMSGIIEERLGQVERAIGEANLSVAERHQSDDWVCLVARRDSASDKNKSQVTHK